jgi:class 3 adenylate cyclase
MDRFESNSVSNNEQSSPSVSQGSVSTTSSMVTFDLGSIIKSSNTISEGLDKKNILSKLNGVIVENAGATKAYIVLREKEKFIVNSETINEAYERFLPKEFLNQLEKKDVRNIQPSECMEKKMTILFSDIRNFTNITDNMDAKESFSFVNEILNELAPSISQNNGFVDKFIGDCVMAIFPDSPLDAVKAGVSMLNSLTKLNLNRQIPVNIGVGIAFGSVMIRTLGYEKRLDATVISSTVNTASRLESLTKSLGVNLLVTEEIYNEIKSSKDLFVYLVGSFYLKGQKDSKKLFEVLSLTEKETFDHQSFEKGLKYFQSQDFHQATVLFNSMDCGIARYYSKVCSLYELNNLPKEWKGEIKISKDGDPQQILSDIYKNSIDKITILQNAMNDPDTLDYLFEYVMKIKK